MLKRFYNDQESIRAVKEVINRPDSGVQQKKLADCQSDNFPRDPDHLMELPF